MATREYDDFLRRQDLVDERVRKPVQECSSHLFVGTHRRVHLGVQAEEADRRVDLRDKRAAETTDASLVLATGLSKFRARLRPKAHAHHCYRRGGVSVRASSAA